MTLPVTPDHPDFLNHYHAARAGQKLEQPSPSSKPIPKSLQWLTDQFESWMEQRVKAGHLHPATLHQRKMFYARLNAEHGSKSMNMPRAKLIEFRDEMLDTPGAANNMIKAIRACYKWAVDRNIVSSNPAVGIPKIQQGNGATPWSIDDLRSFRRRHPLGSTPYLALSLFMFTACRISDIILLGRSNEKIINGVRHISWQPVKKGSAPVIVPILPPLERAIASMAVVGSTYLLNQHGRPYASSSAFGNKFRTWVREAGLEDRSPHGIRKAAGELMALEGATQYHIMAVHGHTQAKTSEIYTSGVNRQKLAAEAIDKLSGMEW